MAAINGIVRLVQRTGPKRLLHREWIQGYLLISPWLIGFFIWTLGPMFFSAIMSFMAWEVLTPPRWIGLTNFTKLTHDRIFYKSLYNTAYYTFFTVPLRLVLALAAALLLYMPSRVMHLYRTFLYMPSAIAAVPSVLLWIWIFNPSFGLANMLLHAVGIAPQMWMLDARQVKPVFIFIDALYIGGPMVIFLAALQGVPVSLKEAALLDGANGWAQFRYVVLPMISPVILFNLIIGIISSFQVFTLAFLATQGGPNYASTFLVLYLYQNGFEYLKMGYAALLAWVLFLIVLVFTVLQLRLARLWVYYEAEF